MGVATEFATAYAPATGTCTGVFIGNISLVLRGASANEVQFSPQLHGFRAPIENPDITIKLEWAKDLPPWPGSSVFDSGPVWKLFHCGRDLVFDFTSPVLGSHPYKRLHVDRDFRFGRILLNRSLHAPHQMVLPLDYPADELLFTNYLASGLGVEVHGCGLLDGDSGAHLFLGHSGAGKSTTARLWRSYRNPEILSDDRIILRLEENELWMYGTPWHGEAAFASPTKAKLKRVFILQHGEHNHICRLPKSRAVGELFARSFPPFHSADGLAHTIEFLNQAVNLVPCYQFQFVPDVSAVEAAMFFHD